MASFVYNSCFRDTFRGRLDFENGQFRIILAGPGYQPSKDEHTRRSDITDEVSGQGYEEGGASIDVHMAMSDDRLTLNLGGTTFPNASIGARYAIYCANHGGLPEDDELIAIIDLGGVVTSTNGDWKLQPSVLRIKN